MKSLGVLIKNLAMEQLWDLAAAEGGDVNSFWLLSATT